jgi:hypothetical protein
MFRPSPLALSHRERRELVHHIHNRSYVVYRGMLQNAVTEIEDMARATLRPAQDVVHALFELRQRCEE